MTDFDFTRLTGLARYLCQDQLLDFATAKVSIHAAEQQKISLVQYLVKTNILSSEDILQCCARHFDLPIYDLKNYDPARLLSYNIKPDLIYQYRVIPLAREQNSIQLGIADPTDHAAITTIAFHTGLRTDLMLVCEKDLNDLINTLCKPNILYSEFEMALAKIMLIKEGNSNQSNEYNDELIIKFVNHLIQNAFVKKISDIHIEPFQNYSRIRFRLDGLLYEVATLPVQIAMQIIMRLKIMANLNIAEKRLPQDGRLQLSLKNKIDMRINVCPTLYGEKTVLRLLDSYQIELNIHSLGFTKEQENIFLNKLSQPHGLIIITGPTGSGKTITLYSALRYLNRIEKNIISIEDPVEIQLEGINQVNVNPKIGFDFANALRAFLRQDPDIIMIGEIRDAETAMIALQAAATGHLVLATLHSNRVSDVISRLQSMDIADYNLKHSLSLIISQRLVRKLCFHCKRYEQSHSTFAALGCERCNLGFQGRIGIFELLPDPEKKSDYLKLWDAGLEKVKAGLTSYAELVRVVGKE